MINITNLGLYEQPIQQQRGNFTDTSDSVISLVMDASSSSSMMDCWCMPDLLIWLQTNSHKFYLSQQCIDKSKKYTILGWHLILRSYAEFKYTDESSDSEHVCSLTRAAVDVGQWRKLRSLQQKHQHRVLRRPAVTPAILSLQISNILTQRARHGPEARRTRPSAAAAACQPVAVAESRDSFIHGVLAIISQLNCLRSSAAIKTEISPAADGA